MRKPNLLELPVPTRRRETRTFTDVLQPGQEFPFTCEGPGAVEMAALAAKDAEYQAMFVAGDKAKGIKVSTLPLIDKSQLTVTAGMAEKFAMLEVFQCPDDPADRWTLPELGLLTKVAPNAWGDICAWLMELYRQPYETPDERDDQGNEPGLPPTT